MTDGQVVALVGAIASIGGAAVGGIGNKIITVLAEKKQVDVRITKEGVDIMREVVETLRADVDRTREHSQRLETTLLDVRRESAEREAKLEATLERVEHENALLRQRVASLESD